MQARSSSTPRAGPRRARWPRSCARSSAERPKTVARPTTQIDAPALIRERILPGTLAGVWTLGITLLLPFYPAGWPFALAAAAAALAAIAPRAGLAFALLLGVFPLGNISQGLGIAYAAAALVWLFIHWRDPRNGLLLVVGPLLAPLGLLALTPLAVQTARGPVRKALQAAGAVGLAAVVAGWHHGRLPFTGLKPPLGLGIATSTRPLSVIGALAREAGAHPPLLAAGVVLAAMAAALPYLRGRGLWPAVLTGAGFLAAIAFAAPAAAFLPLAVAAWACAAAVALPVRGR